MTTKPTPNPAEWQPETRLIHGGTVRSPFGETSEALYLTQSYVYQTAEQAEARRSQVGTGERAEKIRTYNFPENRLTDHRVKHTVHRLDQVLDGDLEEFTEALQAEERRQALEAAV